MKKIIFLITEDWFFHSHFIERAIAAKNIGYDILVCANETHHGDKIKKSGLKIIPIKFDRRSTNIINEIKIILKIWKTYRKEKPDLVHQIAAKPILYGTIASFLSKKPAIVNAPVGMGYVFSSQDGKAKFLKPIIQLGYRLLLNPKNSKVIFENSDDLNDAVTNKAVNKSDAVLIRGAGVNINQLTPTEKNSETPVIVLVARMLRDKGVFEFVQAAHQINNAKTHARFILVGDPDPSNPASISEHQLNSWNNKLGVEWWGWRENIREVLDVADIACLPSYREGLPKSLLEAAACGLPIVTTDTVGCREVVKSGENGFLVPARNTDQLALALKKLIEDPSLRKKMGARSREIAEVEFSSDKIIKETLQVYEKLTQ